MDDDDRLFQAALLRPDRDVFRALLKSKQGLVFAICFRILRNSHDAEDAAQEALIEIIRGIAGIREPKAFRHWLCRVAVTTALDHRRRRDRRARHEESRAAMTPEPHDPAVDAVHDALAHLDDSDRCLLIEKYFGGVTIEAIAKREGLSTAGAGRRIDRAKHRLKERLAQGGLASFIGSVDATLEAAIPVPAIPDLVSSSSAVQSALAHSGVALMTSKVTISITSVVMALVVFTGIGAGGGYWVGLKRASLAAATTKPNSFGEVNVQTLRESSKVKAVTGSKSSEVETPADDSPLEKNVLVVRLGRFQKWMENYERVHPTRTMEDVENRFSAVKVELQGVRDLILNDPRTFLNWIADPTNARVLEPLFDATLTQKIAAYGVRIQDYSSFPALLMNGLLELLRNGSAPVKMAILNFAQYVQNPSEDYRAQYGAWLSDTNQFLASKAAQVLLSRTDPTSAELEGIVGVIERMEVASERSQLLQALGRLPKAESRDWLFKAFESGRLDDPHGHSTHLALQWWLEPGRLTDGTLQTRAANILSASMRKTTNEDAYMMTVWTALCLPSPLALSLVQQALNEAPTEAIRTAATAVLEKSRGDGVTWRSLQETWMSEYNAVRTRAIRK